MRFAKTSLWATSATAWRASQATGSRALVCPLLLPTKIACALLWGHAHIDFWNLNNALHFFIEDKFFLPPYHILSIFIWALGKPKQFFLQGAKSLSYLFQPMHVRLILSASFHWNFSPLLDNGIIVNLCVLMHFLLWCIDGKDALQCKFSAKSIQINKILIGGKNKKKSSISGILYNLVKKFIIKFF